MTAVEFVAIVLHPIQAYRIWRYLSGVDVRSYEVSDE